MSFPRLGTRLSLYSKRLSEMSNITTGNTANESQESADINEGLSLLRFNCVVMDIISIYQFVCYPYLISSQRLKGLLRAYITHTPLYISFEYLKE